MKAIIFERDMLPGQDDDELEEMEVGEYGSVTIWTKHRVWFVRSEAGRLETLKYVPRHPPPAG